MLTYLLIAISVIVSFIGFSMMNKASGRFFYFSPNEVSKGGNYAGMLLSHFSHADGNHLLFNMLTLYFFGPEVEFGLGGMSMLVIYAAAGVVSTLVIYFRHRHDPGYRELGASDSVTAIIFAAIVLNPGGSVYLFFVPIPIPAPVFAVAYIAISMFLMRRGESHTSHEAHLAGAFTGLLLAGFLAEDGLRPLFRTIQNLVS
jgi:membrane associated rhomboid family serine protease